MPDAPQEVQAEFDSWLDGYAEAYASALAKEWGKKDFHTDEPRDDAGRWTEGGGKPGAEAPKAPASTSEAFAKLAAAGALSWDALKSAGISATNVEHAAKEFVADKIGEAVSKLPASMQTVVRGAWIATRVGTKAAFVTYTAGQAAVEAVAKAKGATPEQARRLRGIVSSIDIATAKPLVLGLEATGLGVAAIPASFVPVGSMSYLAYSTATNPQATWRAAKTAIGGALARMRGKSVKDETSDALAAILDGLQTSSDPDYYVACVLAALDETGDLWEAIKVVEEAGK